MLPIIFLHILAYVTYCTAAPTCPAPIDYFKLRVWTYPRAVPQYGGYTELSYGRMSFNITPGYTGFDLVIPRMIPEHFFVVTNLAMRQYLDPANPGMLRQPPSGFYGVLIPTKTPGLYDFSIVSRSSVSKLILV